MICHNFFVSERLVNLAALLTCCRQTVSSRSPKIISSLVCLQKYLIINSPINHRVAPALC